MSAYEELIEKQGRGEKLTSLEFAAWWCSDTVAAEHAAEELAAKDAELSALRAQIKEWEDYFGCESPHDTDVQNATPLGIEQMRNNIVQNENDALRAEVERNREIIADANELLWEFTENPNIEMGEVGHQKIEDYFKKYAPSEGQKRE